jgi:NhaP-type Na+/H+ or K+/H+ antiporter
MPAIPAYKVPLMLGWTGMRGVVSLAAALSIPVTTQRRHTFSAAQPDFVHYIYCDPAYVVIAGIDPALPDQENTHARF